MTRIGALLLPLAAMLSSAGLAGPVRPPLLAKLEAMAAKGNADALYHLGMMSQTGTGTPVDYHRALTYFRQAAAKGQPLGAYKLGCFHAGQYGVLPVDDAEALRWKLIAAEAGYALAQHDVAITFARRGDGAQASAWMTRAAAQGGSESLMGMVALHDPQRGLVRDPAIAAAYLAILAERLDLPAAKQAEVASLRAKLFPGDRARADAIIAGYRATPTTLTTEARSGARAAETLVASGGR